MIRNKTIGVIVPVYNEELLIEETLKGIPEYVDKIIVVNDDSSDRSKEKIVKFEKSNKKIVLINHSKNKGLGASLSDGYIKSLEFNLDVAAVMAGDNQMSPQDLRNVLTPVVEGKVDYVKGNRLLVKDVSKYK